MDGIKVLDCTLRDGGYCNRWEFGDGNISKILHSLIEAEIDIIECGYLSDRAKRDQKRSMYAKMEDVPEVIPENGSDKLFVVMMNWNEYDPMQLPECGRTMIGGVRVAFHKEHREEGLEVCRLIKEKGYKVFVQAMVSLDYSDQEFLDLIEKANEIMPYAFYIVDSFGVMKKKDLMHLFYMLEKNLSEDIWIGFHSHNNLQLAYANAQSLVDLPMKRNLIIDASVYGMGRGAGNLNTELFVEYLNESCNKDYKIEPLLEIIDEILSIFYAREPWGYTLPNYLSAIHKIHPNYALYLDAKKTLTVKEMDKIFSAFDAGKGASFDQDYIEKMYVGFLDKKTEVEETSGTKVFQGRTVLLVAPGNSIVAERDRIIACASQKEVTTVSVNFEYPEVESDFIFLSNLRRYRELDKGLLKKCIVTSNIPADNVLLKVSYQKLLNSEKYVEDNAGLLLINLLIQSGAKKVLLAGFDGYSSEESENYALSNMVVYRRKEVLKEMNIEMQRVLQDYGRQIEIEFLTRQKYVSLH